VVGCLLAYRTSDVGKLRIAMGHRDSLYRLKHWIELDDALMGGKRPFEPSLSGLITRCTVNSAI